MKLTAILRVFIQTGATWLLLIALLYQGMIAPGMMPTAQVGQDWQIIHCTSYPTTSGFTPDPLAPKKSEEAPCVFAQHHTLLASALLFISPTIHKTYFTYTAEPPLAVAFLAVRPFVSLPPHRGPPRLA